MGRRSRQSLGRHEQDAVRELIRDLRMEAGVSQRGLSAALQENPTFIARIERGDRTLDVVEFLDIMSALKVEPIAGFHKLLRMLDERSSESNKPLDRF